MKANFKVTIMVCMILLSCLKRNVHADEAEGWFNRGNQFREEGRLLEAIDAYQRSIAINPNYWVVYLNLGLAFKKTRQFPRAVDAFQNALKLAPDNLDIHLNLGNVYNYLENWEAAIQHLNLLVHRRQNDAVAHGNLGWALYNYNRGPPLNYSSSSISGERLPYLMFRTRGRRRKQRGKP